MSLGEMVVLSNGNLQIKTSEHGKLTLIHWKIQPLSLTDLQDFKNDSKVNIRLTDLKVLEDPKISEISVSTTTPDVLGSYCLVQGGWLPPGFGMLNSTAFADRNFITKLVSNFLGDKAKNAEVSEWFDDLKNFNLKIDIVPYAMEGNKKKFPSKDEVEAQIEEAKKKLRVAAPGIPVVKYPVALKDYAWSLVDHIKPSIQNRMNFLTKAAPFIKVSSNKETILERWRAIAAIAKNHDLSTDVIHFLALISVSAPQRNSPGLGILKINHPYPAETAYNACFDISLMEIFLNLQKMNPPGRYTIITSDLGLARFGGLLNELNHTSSDGVKSKFSARIPQELIGCDSDLHKEFQRLTSDTQ